MLFMKRILVRRAVCAVAACLAFMVEAQIRAPQLDLPRERLSIGVHRIDVQVASQPGERQVGLMLRRDLPAGEGMLFVFDQDAVQCFWMKDTLLPLTVAFVADDGTIVNLEDMQPQSTDSHCSSRPVRYVLEMNQGWFSSKHVKPGFKLSGARFDTQTAPKAK